MKPPLITVVFPTYQRQEEVIRTINSLRENITLPFELFIIDNSPKAMDLKLRNNEFYQFLGHNAGTSARNFGIQNASSPVVLMLDDDSHPLPNSIEKVLPKLLDTPDDVAGFIGKILDQKGNRTASLLPTVFHGCGAAFKTKALRKIKRGYPEKFCFYGEEYWLTMLLYKHNFRLIPCDELKVCHRLSNKERSLDKIFYHLVRNNRILWEEFTPDLFLESALYDSNRRYELIAKKEGVSQAFERGFLESLTSENRNGKLSTDQFMKFSLMNSFDCLANRLDPENHIVLCGCGKFPVTWSRRMENHGISKIEIADFNPGLIGQKVGKYTVKSPQEVVLLRSQKFRFITGHSSSSDHEKWGDFLDRNQIPLESRSLVA